MKSLAVELTAAFAKSAALSRFCVCPGRARSRLGVPEEKAGAAAVGNRGGAISMMSKAMARSHFSQNSGYTSAYVERGVLG